MKQLQSKCFFGIKNFYNNINKNSFNDIECLILSMPFVVVNQPTMGVSILKNTLNKGGIKTDVHYPCIPFSVALPTELYNWFGCNVYDRIGDFFFSEIIFGKNEYREKKMINTLCELYKNNRFPHCKDIDNVEKFIEYIPMLRNITQSIIKEIVSLVKQHSNIKIVCCSATFVQLFPSLAVLKEIKNTIPNVTTIIGGCECEGEAAGEIVKNFDFVDYACSGEGDTTLVDLCKTILYKNSLSKNLPHGVYDKDKAISSSIESAIVMDNDIIRPDHSRYYEELMYFPQYHKDRLNYTFELSRGCWKGKKSHCTFCGFNGKRMDYRKRQTNDVIEEINNAYNNGHRIFYATDAVIDLNHMKPIFDFFRKECPDAIFMCDTVSSLSYKQMEYLSDSGILIITAGIESLHPTHLKLLRKNTNAIDNIAYLKYAKINKMHILWNMLTIIPGDSAKEYDELTELIKNLEHLTPPNYSIIRYDRHSLYWETPSHYGLKLAPMKNCEYLFPKNTEINLNAISMYFDNIAPNSLIKHDDKSLMNLYSQIREWQILYRKSPILILNDDIIVDTRSISICSSYHVTNDDKFILNYLFSPKSITETINFVYENRLQEAFNNLIKMKYLIKWDNAYLSLVTLPISKNREEYIIKRWNNIKVDNL